MKTDPFEHDCYDIICQSSSLEENSRRLGDFAYSDRLLPNELAHTQTSSDHERQRFYSFKALQTS